MKQIYCALLLTLVSSISFSQSTITWNFGTAAANPSPSSGVPIPGLVISDISQGNNNGTTTLLTTTSASSGYAGASGQFNAGAAARVGVLNTGASGSAYFEFTLTPNAANTVNISNINFGTRSTSTGPQAYTVRTSLDNFASDIITGAIANNSVWVLKSNSTNVTSIAGTPVTIRIYGYNGAGSAAAGTANWRIDDLAVTVTVFGGGTPTPTLNVSPISLSGYYTATGIASASQDINVSGVDLTDNVSITAASPYELSTGSTYSSSVILSPTGGTLSNTTVHVRISASASTGVTNGTVTVSSSGATDKTVSLSGNVTDLITLSTSPYIQNFNGISSGLPTGVTVKTAAAVSALGTDAAFAVSPAQWNNTGGGFKNFASGNNDQGVTQNAATDRAIGIRQTGSFGDPGGAFVFHVANTSGKINFTLDFNLQSLDASSARVTTWRVDYGFGINPSSFIVPSTTGILTTGGNAFSNSPIHVNFGNALDNQSNVITIRIVALTPSSGSGNRASTGIDDFILSWEDPSAKTMTLSTTAINFPITNNGATNSATYKIISQTNLDQPISITATNPYAISTDNVNFVSNLSLAPADAFDKTIYVRFSPLSAGVYPGTITHSSEGTASKIINLSGEAVDPNALTFNFNTCTVSSVPGAGFLSINVTGTQKWQCSQYGRNGTNGVDVNGFSGGAAQTDDAWLISPALNLSDIVNIPVLSFYSRGEFNGPKLQLYASTSYDGSSVPNLADWTLLEGNFPAPPGSATTTWTFSDNIDLSTYKSSPKVFIAFRYTSSPALNAARWSLDDIAITDQSTLLTVSPSQLNFGEISAGTNSAGQAVSFKAIGNDDLSVTPPAGYQISTDNSSFTANAIVIDQATAAAGTTLYVRFSPTEKALKVEGDIHVTADGLDKNIVALTGSSYPKSETFDVACYNLAFFGSNSTNTATPEQVATKVANISTVVQHLNADVIGIEEMSSDDALTQLMATLPGYSSVISNRWSYSFNPPDPSFPPQKIGFIYNTSTMSLSSDEPPRVMFESMYDSARLNLPGHRLADYPTGTPSSFWASGRLPFMATFNATIDGVTRKIRIIVIHAKSGGDVDGYTRRQYDAKVLKDSLDAFYSNDRLIIVGDYNDRVVTSIYLGHQSSYQPFVDDNLNYDILTEPLDSTGKTSFPGDAGMIDHVTITNHLVNEYINNSTDVEDARSYIANYNATTGSDHLPVFSRFQYCKLTCPENITVSNDPGQCGAVVNFNVSSTMTCGTVTADLPSGTFFPIGATTVHLTASSGDTCSFIVTVNDNENPTIDPPGAISANNDPGKCYATIANLGTPIINDNCGVPTVTNDAPVTNQFAIGTTTVTWMVTDLYGHTAVATQVVTVTDNENPTITCPGDQTRNTNSDVCTYTAVGAEFDAFANDNCDGFSVINNLNHTNSLANWTFIKGQTQVTWTVADAVGNTASCSFIVTVEDHQAPIVTAPNDVIVAPNNSSCTAKNVSLGTPVYSDNCEGAIVSNNAPSIFPLGSTLVTWTVTDASGNSTTARQTVTVAVNPPILSSIDDAYAVNPGGAANTIYIGYGPSSVILHGNVTGGAGSYSYKWTIGSSAGPALNTSASYTVSPTSNTTYYFNAKDVFGCSASLVTKTIYVEDIRCGARMDKVTVCQFVKGKSTTSCIASKDVASALASGSYLGACINTVTKANVAVENPQASLTVSAMPNPSSGYFTINLRGGNSSEKLSMIVIDILGRKIEQRENLQTNSVLKIGGHYLPGIYLVEVMQGNTRKQIKLIKAGN